MGLEPILASWKDDILPLDEKDFKGFNGIRTHIYKFATYSTSRCTIKPKIFGFYIKPRKYFWLQTKFFKNKKIGGNGIRTRDTKGMFVFKTNAFNRSAIPPSHTIF